jgi:competence protein ComEC
VGFQLSFLSVFAIISGFRLFPVKFAKNTILAYAEGIFFSSLFVTVMLTPVVSYYFAKVYILSIIYNIILIPFFTLILTINFIFIIFSPLAVLAQSIGRVLSILIDLFYSLIKFLSSIKFSYITLRFSSLAVSVYYAVLAIIVVFIKYIKANIERRRHFYPV